VELVDSTPPEVESKEGDDWEYEEAVFSPVYTTLSQQVAAVYAFTSSTIIQKYNRNPFADDELTDVDIDPTKSHSLDSKVMNKDGHSDNHSRFVDSASPYRPLQGHDEGYGEKHSSAVELNLFRERITKEDTAPQRDDIELQALNTNHMQISTNPLLCIELSTQTTHDNYGRNTSVISVNSDEMSQTDPPWVAFFTHPVGITLLINGWFYVRYL